VTTAAIIAITKSYRLASSSAWLTMVTILFLRNSGVVSHHLIFDLIGCERVRRSLVAGSRLEGQPAALECRNVETRPRADSY
jgi:hypothetical protein